MSDLVSEPLVSIIIPTYNQSIFLENTIRSAQSQTYSNIEIIVVDDHSTDNTSEVVDTLAQIDSRIKYLRTPKQSNLPAVPRNIGIKNANGEYVAFLDHDDLWRKKKLRVQIAELEKDQQISMVYSPLWQFSGHNFFWGLVLLRPPHLDRDSRYLNQENPIQCSSVVIKKDDLDSLKGFNESVELRAVEDYELWLRVSSAYKIKEIYTVLGYYRHFRASTSQNENMNLRLETLKKIHPYVASQKKSSLLARVVFRIRITPLIIAKLRF